MSKLDKDQVIENFTQAYQKAHGKKPNIEAKGGWYSVDGDKNVRLAVLEEMTAELSKADTPPKKALAKKAPAKKAEAKVEKPAEKKAEPKAPKKPAVKKAAPKAKKAKQSGGFSVKAFWNEQIEARNPGSKHPR
jgi:glucan-binding YG repeat protein